MTRPNFPSSAPDPDLPPDLREALRRLDQRPLPNFADTDTFILAQARSRLAHRSRWKLALRTAGGLAAAAVLLLTAWTGYQLWTPARSGNHPSGIAILTPSQHPTILDAFHLARLLKAGQTASSAWDVTGDGVIDQRDVDELARRAVKIPSAPTSKNEPSAQAEESDFSPALARQPLLAASGQGDGA